MDEIILQLQSVYRNISSLKTKLDSNILLQVAKNIEALTVEPDLTKIAPYLHGILSNSQLFLPVLNICYHLERKSQDFISYKYYFDLLIAAYITLETNGRIDQIVISYILFIADKQLSKGIYQFSKPILSAISHHVDIRQKGIFQFLEQLASSIDLNSHHEFAMFLCHENRALYFRPILDQQLSCGHLSPLFLSHLSLSTSKFETARKFISSWPGLFSYGISSGAISNLVLSLHHSSEKIHQLKSLLFLNTPYPSVTDAYTGILVHYILQQGILQELEEITQNPVDTELAQAASSFSIALYPYTQNFQNSINYQSFGYISSTNQNCEKFNSSMINPFLMQSYLTYFSLVT